MKLIGVIIKPDKKKKSKVGLKHLIYLKYLEKNVVNSSLQTECEKLFVLAAPLNPRITDPQNTLHSKELTCLCFYLKGL